MATPRVKRLFPVALSISALAESLGIDRRHIDRAVRDGTLPQYQIGVAKKILVEDAVRWVRENWKRVKP